MNLDIYGYNNPLITIDPTGHFVWFLIPAVPYIIPALSAIAVAGTALIMDHELNKAMVLQQPKIEPKPTVSQQPVYQQKSVVSQQPVTQQKPIVSQQPIFQQKSVVLTVKNTSDIPSQGMIKGQVNGAPIVHAGNQGKHVVGHPNQAQTNKDSLWIGNGSESVYWTQKAWQEGREAKYDAKSGEITKVFNTGGAIVGRNGETTVMVKYAPSTGSIHGYPVKR